MQSGGPLPGAAQSRCRQGLWRRLRVDTRKAWAQRCRCAWQIMLGACRSMCVGAAQRGSGRGTPCASAQLVFQVTARTDLAPTLIDRHSSLRSLSAGFCQSGAPATRPALVQHPRTCADACRPYRAVVTHKQSMQHAALLLHCGGMQCCCKSVEAV